MMPMNEAPKPVPANTAAARNHGRLPKPSATSVSAVPVASVVVP